MLYEAATRNLPFAGPSMLAVLHAIAATDPAPPSRLRPDLLQEFDLIIERALAKEKEKRYSSAGELAEALRSVRAALSGAWLGGPIIYDTDLIDTSAVSFVGRDLELGKLEDFLQRTIDGSGRLVFISGEPGIGKTTLCDEFYGGHAHALWRCQLHADVVLSSTAGEAYLHFLMHMRIARRTARDDWRDKRTSARPGAHNAGGFLRRRRLKKCNRDHRRYQGTMMREMGDALSAMANVSPVVLLLEDFTGGPSSVDLLRHLGQRLGHQRLMITGTFRPETLNALIIHSRVIKRSYKRINCARRSRWTRSVLTHSGLPKRNFTPHKFPSEFAEHIHDKTKGILCLQRIFCNTCKREVTCENKRALVVKSPLSEMEMEVPQTVRSMISKKVDSLAEEERRALQYASVEGQEFHSPVVASLVGVDEVYLEELLARIEKTHRLIITEGEEEFPDRTLTTRYRFSHALYQNLLYDDLVNKRRVLLHRQVGEQLERHYGQRARQIAAQLARHFELGATFRGQWSIWCTRRTTLARSTRTRKR